MDYVDLYALFGVTYSLLVQLLLVLYRNWDIIDYQNTVFQVVEYKFQKNSMKNIHNLIISHTSFLFSIPLFLKIMNYSNYFGLYFMNHSLTIILINWCKSTYIIFYTSIIVYKFSFLSFFFLFYISKPLKSINN